MKTNILKSLFVTVFAFCSSICAFSQNCVLQGTVKDESFLPVEFANIVILTESDSSFVAGCVTTDTGSFSIHSLKEGNYILKTSFITFQDVYKNIRISNSNSDIGVIYLKSQERELKEVVVTSRRPPFKVKQGSLLADISNTQLSTLGTATDVIQRIPGVVAGDDNISVFGKGTPIVYIDNRIVKDFTELNILQSADIATIELITNPGAKYDASGRALILVKTKKKKSGFSTQVSKKFIVGNYFGGDENINISLTKNNFSFFASYNHMYQKRKTKEEDTYLARFDTIWNHKINTPYVSSVTRNQFSTGFDWSINEKHSIGLQYQTFFFSSKNRINMEGKTFSNEEIYDKISSLSDIREKPYRHLINTFYIGKLSKTTSLQFIFDYLKNHTERDQLTHETSILKPSREVNVTNQSNFHLYATKLILTQKLGPGTLDFGGEYNKITGDGYLINNKGYIRNNIYTNEEQKFAGFIDYHNSWNGFEFNTGLRYEYSEEKATEDSIKLIKTNRTYSAIYPALSISKKIDKTHLNLSFNKKIQRPSFTQLNGNVVYVNRFMMQKGNPYLKKTDIYDLNIVATYNKMYFNIGYLYQKDPISFYSEKDSFQNVIYTTVSNYPKYQEINLTVNYNSKIGWWQPNLTLRVRKPFFSILTENEKSRYNDPDLSIQAYNDFALGSDFILSLNVTYQTDYSYYLIKLANYKKIDIGLRKSFLDKRLRLNMEVRDIFNWVHDKNQIEVNQIRMNQARKNETRFVILTVSYLFNNYKKKYRGSSAAKDDINRL